MRQNVRIFSLGLFGLFFVVSVLGGLFWANMNYVRTLGGGENFILGWKSTRNFFMQGISPYSDLNLQDVQREIYKRLARPDEPQYRFADPLYYSLLNIPLGSISDRRAALALWMLFIQAATAGLLYLCLKVGKWRPGWLYLILLAAFTFTWLPGAFAFHRGSSIIVQVLLILGALRAAELEIDELAGALLLFASFNLEALGPAILLILFWAASAQRWRIWAGYTMLFVVLFGSAFIVLPGWPLQYVRAAYQNLFSGLTPSLPLIFSTWFPALGTRMAQFVIGVTAVIVLIEWYAVRNKHVYWLYWTVSLTIAATPLMGLPTTPENQAAFLPAFILILSVMELRWKTFGRWLAIILLSGFWIGLWVLGAASAVSFQMHLFLPVAFFIMLYWIRWWVARPPRLWADTVPIR
jgi:hypothetical protein